MGALPFEFVPFGSSARDSAVSCDGLVEGASLHASHWEGNRTPPELKADTSTGIALGLARRGVPAGATIANNHFDVDGALSVFSLLEPDVASRHAALLVGAAEAGDFDEWPADDRALRLEIAVRAVGRGQWSGGAAPRTLAGGDARAYAEVLPRLPELLAHLDDHRPLWEAEWKALLDADRRAGEGGLEVQRAGGIAVLAHRRGTAELPGPVLSRRAPRGVTRWLLALEQEDGRFHYRYERPRWAWADTVTRPRIVPPSRNATVRGLGEEWVIKGDLGMTGIARTARPIALDPSVVVSILLKNDPGAAREVR
jgi:hypothetical protein